MCRMWYKKDQIRQEAGKLIEPSQAGGMLTEEYCCSKWRQKGYTMLDDWVLQRL